MTARPHDPVSRASIVALVLTIVGAAPAVAQILDQGTVVVDPSNNLRIGIDAFGQRDITNATDGPYAAITLGEALGGDGRLILGQGGSLSATGELSVGLPTGGTGYLQLTDGATLSTAGARVASPYFAPGPEVFVSGLGTSWTNSGILYLGQPEDELSSLYSGTARMWVSNGARVETVGLSMSSSGGPTFSALTLSGAGTQLLNSGNLTVFGSGLTTIDVLDGARYQSSGSLSMGNNYNIIRIGVSGTDSVFEVGGSLISGRFYSYPDEQAEASMDVNNGGHLITGDATLWTQTWVEARISDPGSRWTVNGELSLAMNGAGGDNYLEILNGAKVTSQSGNVTALGYANVMISGPESEWNSSGRFTISSSGRTSILIEGGGTLRTGNAVIGSCYGYDDPPVAHGCFLTVHGSSSIWIGSGDLSVGSRFYRKASVSAINNAAIAFAGTTTIDSGGFVTLDHATLTVGRDLILAERDPGTVGGPSLSATGASINLSGHFSHDRQAVAEVGLGDSAIAMAGDDTFPGLSFHGLEVGGLDAGDPCNLLTDDNFGIGQLVVGQTGMPTTVGLYDAMDNGHRNGPGGAGEALYLFGGGTGSRCTRSSDGLVMEPGSILELNGIDTYVYDAAQTQLVHLNALYPGSPDPNEISMFGGTIRLVPEPGILIGIIEGGTTLVSMAGLRSKRQARQESRLLN